MADGALREVNDVTASTDAALADAAGSPDGAARYTVAICTRDRPEDAAVAAASVVRSVDSECLEVLVIDQSDSEATSRAMATLATDWPVIRYVRTPSRGLSVARNLAISLTHAPFVVFTDDDCQVSAGWAPALVGALADDPQATVAFSDVVAGACAAGTATPESIADRAFTVDRPRRWRAPDGLGVGIGASMAVRRERVVGLGGFDPALGAGGPLRSGEDFDLALRAVVAGDHIIRLQSPAVVHHGSRSLDDFRQIARDAMNGVGYSCGQQLVLHPVRAGVITLRVIHGGIVAPAARDVLRASLPRVLGRTVYFARGVARGLSVGVRAGRAARRSGRR